jgi:hypothetical protein
MCRHCYEIPEYAGSNRINRHQGTKQNNHMTPLETQCAKTVFWRVMASGLAIILGIILAMILTDTTVPMKLSEAKSWWVVYATGLQRGSIKTTAANFAHYNDACTWAVQKRNKGLCVRIEEEHEVAL